MDFGHLRLFRDVAQTGSLSRGAALNGISQSAASQHLQDLERDLGIDLLDRSTRPFTLTAAGHLYFDLCRDVLRRKDEFDVAVEQLKGKLEGTVRVASIYSIGLSEMRSLKDEFTERFPNARLEVEYLRPDKVYEAVLKEQADLGFVSYPEGSRALAVIPWREEDMVVAAAPAHPLARKKKVRPKDLDGLDFVAFDPDLPIRRDIDRFLREQGVKVNIAMHFDNIEMVKEAVALGAAISILPARVMETEILQNRLVEIPMEADLVRPIGILHRRKKKFHRAAQALVELLRESVASGAPVTGR